MVDQVLVAAGRVANVQTLAIDRAGLTVNKRGLLAVNEHYQTSVPPHLRGRRRHRLSRPGLDLDGAGARGDGARLRPAKYKTQVAPVFPLAVYTIPEIAMAGETEESCRQKKIDYCVGRGFYRTNARGQIIGDLSGEVKLVFRYPDKRLLGVHVIGEIAAELVHIGLMALQTEGTIDMFINTVFNYPSLGDAYKYAAYDGLGAVQRREAPPPSASGRGGGASALQMWRGVARTRSGSTPRRGDRGEPGCRARRTSATPRAENLRPGD